MTQHFECITEFSKDYLVRENKDSKIVLHTSYDDEDNFNKYAKQSLEIDNDAKRRAKDEAISIHIITAKLKTRLNILYERQICAFYGKPDFIIRLGRNLYLMVSTTRALFHDKPIRKNGRSLLYPDTPKTPAEFTQKEADRLMKKKLIGLSICQNNLECLVDEVVDDKHIVIPILHILSPNRVNALMCIGSYNKILKENDIDKIKLNRIKIVISHIEHHETLL